MIRGQNLLKIPSDYYDEDIEAASDSEDKGEDDRLLSINSEFVKNRVKIELEVRKSGQSSKNKKEKKKKKKKQKKNRMEEVGHLCKVCGKVFSSGKALGGHMRVHNSDRDDNAITKKPTSVEQARVGNSAVKAAWPTCSECGKHFPSEKSLYGHMRCHPERSWRGINPPLSSARNSSSSTVDSGGAEKMDDQMDSATTETAAALAGAPSLATWPVTARRGRKIPLAPPRSGDGTADEVRDGEAVANLLFLAQGMKAETKGSISWKKVVKDNREDSTGSSEEQELVMKELKYYPDPRNIGVEDGNEDHSGEESESTTCNRQLDIHNHNTVSGNGTTMQRKKKKKKRKFRALDTVTSGKYKCSTCNKTFYSHQALGGHRASHKKYKSQSPCAEVEEEEEEEEGNEEEEEEEEAAEEEEGAAAYEEGKSHYEGWNESAVEAHRCQICGKTFPTGQALGGHKRCHYVAPTETAVSSVISSPEDVQKPAIRVLNFDLNEMPQMEEEEVDDDDDVRLH